MPRWARGGFAGLMPRQIDDESWGARRGAGVPRRAPRCVSAPSLLAFTLMLLSGTVWAYSPAHMLIPLRLFQYVRGLQNFRFAAPASLSAFPVRRFSRCNISCGTVIISYFSEPRSGCGSKKFKRLFVRRIPTMTHYCITHINTVYCILAASVYCGIAVDPAREIVA